jgi:hypothetical protein
MMPWWSPGMVRIHHSGPQFQLDPCSASSLFQSGDPMPLTRFILNEGIADGYRPSLYLDVCYDPVKGEKVAVADLSGTISP